MEEIIREIETLICQLEWKQLKGILDSFDYAAASHVVTKLIKCNVLGLILESQSEDAVQFLSLIIHPLLFITPKDVNGIASLRSLDVSDLDVAVLSPHRARLLIGYLYLNASYELDLGLTVWNFVCGVIQSSIAFEGDSTHHLAYLFIVLQPSTPFNFQPLTISLLLRRMQLSFEMGPSRSLNRIISWLWEKMDSVSSINDFVCGLTFEFAKANEEKVWNDRRAMSSLLMNFDWSLHQDYSSINLFCTLVLGYTGDDEREEEQIRRITMSLYSNVVYSRPLWSCMESLNQVFIKYWGQATLSDLGKCLSTQLPFELMREIQWIQEFVDQNKFLALSKECTESIHFVVDLISTYSLFNAYSLLMSVPYLLESVQLLSKITSHNKDLNDCALAGCWLLNMLNLHGKPHFKSVPKFGVHSDEFSFRLKTRQGSVLLLIHLDRLSKELYKNGRKGTKEERDGLVLVWNDLRQLLSLIATYPLSKLSPLLLRAITWCTYLILDWCKDTQLGEMYALTDRMLFFAKD